ncbi:hypothetical protein LJC14_00120 [Treponema sp. OttesenSCG-928-L16]|nr:hypothetical protein [Treponema sp. OttesenSCG-928-L16]
MSKKAPGFFRKPMPEKKFQRKYLKYIEQPADKKFILSCFELKEGRYAIKGDLDDKSIKRLKALVKVIKTNRKGTVRIVPLAAAAAVIAAAVIFFTFLLNPILESAIERGLESIFEAKCDVDNFKLSLLKLSVAVDGISIANRDHPMKNLIEIGRSEFRLKPAAVFKGRIYIEEIRADALRFGTPRTVSGALPDKPAKELVKKSAPEIPALVNLENFDAMALLEQEYDKLQTPKAYEAVEAAYSASVEKWKGQVAAAESRSDELWDAARPFVNFNVNDLQNAEDIVQLIRDVTSMVNSVQGAADDVNNIVNGIQEDIDTVSQLEKMARSSITGDIDHLKSYLDFGSGAVLEALEPTIRAILTDAAEEYIEYGVRALEVVEKLKALSESLPKKEPKEKEKKEAFKGRDVVFPSDQYPRFYLGQFASDFTIDDWKWAFDLRSVSSDPDLSGRPTELMLSLRETETASLKREFSFSGSADFRRTANELFTAAFAGKGFPVKVDDYLEKLGMGEFAGDASFSLAFSGARDGSFGGGGDIGVSNAGLASASGVFANAVDQAVRKMGSVDLGLRYSHSASGDDDFSVSTNIGELILQTLRQTAEQYAKKAMDEIERALRNYAAENLEGKLASKEELDQLFSIVKGDKQALDELKNSLENKRNEFERKIKGAAEEAVQQAADEAKRQAEEAAAEARRKAEEAAAEAKRQAEEAAKEAAQKALQDALKSSGSSRFPF